MDMEAPNKKLLLKMANEPGLSTLEEAQEMFNWLQYFNKHLVLYKEVFGEPAGHSVDGLLNKVEYYVNRR